jgi:hypothetical protein
MSKAFRNLQERLIATVTPPSALQVLYWYLTGEWFEVSGATTLLVVLALCIFFNELILEISHGIFKMTK